ncbi:hypothetical protein WDZ92_42455, partial [Nostoc sp. NIES-2111]
MPDIIRFLLDGKAPGPDLVRHVHQLGHDALVLAMRDPVFVEAVWLLVCLPQVAAAPLFEEGAHAIGVRLAGPVSVASLLASVDAALERVQRQCQSDATDLGEIARQAALSSLNEAVHSRLPGLWEAISEDVRHALAALRSAEATAALVQQFHARFVERILHYYIDRNLHRMVGPERTSRSLSDRQNFEAALRRHCDEASLIMRGFARDWLGVNIYRDGKTLTQKDVRRFTAYSLE